MPKRARTSKNTTRKSQKPDLPPLHASQEAVAQRMHNVNRGEQAPILVAPPGKGKTRTMARYLDLLDGDGTTRLVVVITADVSAARKQAVEFGALRGSYQKASHYTQVAAILKDGNSARVVMSPAMFYKLAFGEPQKDGARKPDQLEYFNDKFLSMLGDTCREIVFVFDEIHTIQKKPDLDDAMGKMRQLANCAGVTIYCAGLTATPNEEALSPKLMGKPAITIEYTTEELEDFDKELCLQPVVSDWKPVDLKTPDTNTHGDELQQLQTVILGGMVTTLADLKSEAYASGCHWMLVQQAPGGTLIENDGLSKALFSGKTHFTRAELDALGVPSTLPHWCYVKVVAAPKSPKSPTKSPKSRKKQKQAVQTQYFKPLRLGIGTTTATTVERLLSKILAEQAHGEIGGEVFSHLDIPGRPMRRVVDGALSEETQNMHDGVLIAHAKPSGAQFAVDWLRALQDKVDEGGVREFASEDLRFNGDMKAQDDAIANFIEQFKEQSTGPSLGVINPSQMKATNDFGRNVSAAICIGPTEWMTPTKRKQLRGRLGRPGTLADGSIVPVEFKLIWLKSSWAGKVLGIHKNKTVTVTLTPAVAELWEKLKQSGKTDDELTRVETNMRKLLKVDEQNLFHDALAETYLSAELDPARKAELLIDYMETCEGTLAYMEKVSDEDE